ncbi:MAG: DUF4390 domain-containing protein [Gallionellaceae bacterium]
MRCCTKTLNLLFKLVALLCLCVCTSVANAQGIDIIKAKTRAVDNGYEIYADFKINLPPSVAEALTRGVTLNFYSELTITRSRWYWLDTTVSQNEENTKLFYNALTRQYRISRGSLFQSFLSLNSALRVLGHRIAPPVAASALSSGSGSIARFVQGEVTYTAFAQMRLDTSLLPKPLQVSALTDSDWNLESEKHSWPIKVIMPSPEKLAEPEKLTEPEKAAVIPEEAPQP